MDIKPVAFVIFGLVLIVAITGTALLLTGKLSGYASYNPSPPEQCMQMCNQLAPYQSDTWNACSQQCQPWVRGRVVHTAMPTAIALP